MHLFTDAVVLFAKGQQLGEFVLKLGDAVAQGDQLALGEGDGLSVVGVGHRQVGQQGRVLVEEFGVCLQELDDVGSFHGVGPGWKWAWRFREA